MRSRSAVPAEAVTGDSTVRVRPHIHEGRPAEELHEPDGDERTDDAVLGLCILGSVSGRLFGFIESVELSVLLRIHLLNDEEGVEGAEDEDSGAYIERPLDRVRHYAFGSRISYTDPSEEYREEVTHDRAGVTESRLDSVGGTFLFLVDHIANHHLEGLHRYINRCIQEHE